jgi:hypothetical protein
MSEIKNPFTLTRAVDLTDEQINKLWVDLDTEGGFFQKAKPSSLMPMIIMGGKGSGKTHLMRYYSFNNQRLRAAPGALSDQIGKEQYLGIYVRCSGLNASRFSGKNQSTDRWTALFAYYNELWFAQILLATTEEFLAACGMKWPDPEAICREFCMLFDMAFEHQPRTIVEFRNELRNLQRELDFQVNNAAFSRTVNVQLRTSRGKLIFGLPKIIAASVPLCAKLTFLYLIDEYENFDAEAQKYFNTLIREKEQPVSFKIGVKLFGLRTFKTLSGNEDLKQGSEWEKLTLDADLRENQDVYRGFAFNLCSARLREFFAEQNTSVAWHQAMRATDLKGFFENEENVPNEKTPWGRACERYQARPRPCVELLGKKLRDNLGSVRDLGLKSESDIAEVEKQLTFASDLLLEKANTFLFYRAWSGRELLTEAAVRIRNDCEAYYAGEKKGTLHVNILRHYAGDLRDQFIRECGEKVGYLGLETFTTMSHGIARNLLIILKHVYDWALFYGERPFNGQPISMRAQRAGVQDACDWFYKDAQITGEDAKFVTSGIGRICDLFQAIRFSDKPSECSLTTFSVDVDELDVQTRNVLTLSEQWSLLIRLTDRRERNSGKPVAKFQINYMLSPRFLLPLASRGNIHLSAEQTKAIFGTDDVGAFEQVRGDVLRKMNAPFFGSSPNHEHELQFL